MSSFESPIRFRPTQTQEVPPSRQTTLEEGLFLARLSPSNAVSARGAQRIDDSKQRLLYAGLGPSPKSVDRQAALDRASAHAAYALAQKQGGSAPAVSSPLASSSSAAPLASSSSPRSGFNRSYTTLPIEASGALLASFYSGASSGPVIDPRLRAEQAIHQAQQATLESQLVESQRARAMKEAKAQQDAALKASWVAKESEAVARLQGQLESAKAELQATRQDLVVKAEEAAGLRAQLRRMAELSGQLLALVDTQTAGQFASAFSDLSLEIASASLLGTSASETSLASSLSLEGGMQSVSAALRSAAELDDRAVKAMAAGAQLRQELGDIDGTSLAQPQQQQRGRGSGSEFGSTLSASRDLQFALEEALRGPSVGGLGRAAASFDRERDGGRGSERESISSALAPLLLSPTPTSESASASASSANRRSLSRRTSPSLSSPSSASRRLTAAQPPPPSFPSPSSASPSRSPSLSRSNLLKSPETVGLNRNSVVAATSGSNSNNISLSNKAMSIMAGMNRGAQVNNPSPATAAFAAASGMTVQPTGSGSWRLQTIPAPAPGGIPIHIQGPVVFKRAEDKAAAMAIGTNIDAALTGSLMGKNQSMASFLLSRLNEA